MKTPPKKKGIILILSNSAIVDMPGEGETTVQRTPEFPITVICDQVTDPGNMGTLIRTAAAIGCHKFITMKGKSSSLCQKLLALSPSQVKIGLG
jgi:tRNA G18 (ribose-2'-O)-methylase SpoU